MIKNIVSQKNRTMIKFLAVMTVFIGLTACSSPEEVKQSYYETGLELLEEKDYVKANIEFRNALQIDENFVPAWYAMARLEEERQEWERLYSLLSKVVELEPTHLPAQIKLGKLMILIGQIDRAVEISDAAILLDNTNANVLALKAAVLFKLEDGVAAIDYANRALAIEPTNLDAIQVLAAERYSKGDYEETIRFIDQGLAHNERNIDLLLIKIQTYDSMAESDDAEAIYEELISYYPDDKDIRLNFVNFYIKYDKLDQAEAQLRSIMDLDPSDFDNSINVVRFLNTHQGSDAAEVELETLIQRGIDIVKYQLALAEFYLGNNKNAEAVEVLTSISDRTGSSEDGLVARGRLGQLALDQGNIDEASKIIEEILAIDNTNITALEMRSSISINQENLDEAIQDLRIVLNEDPQSVRASRLLSKAYELNGSIELADDALADALRFSNTDSAVGIEYSNFLLKHSAPARAEEVLKNVLTVKPNDIGSLRALARVYILRQEWVGAQQVADALEKLGDDENVSSQIQGLAYRGQQNFEQSIVSFKKAYSSSPGERRPLASLIGAYISAGKIDEAEAFLNSLLEENENNYQALVLLAQMMLFSQNQEGAIDTLLKAVEKAPDQDLAYTTLAGVYITNGDFASAKKYINDGIINAQTKGSLKLIKANIYEREENFEEAINVYEEMYASNPNSDVVINNLASLLSEHRNDEESIQRALELASRFRQSSIPHFKDTLGWIYYKVGDIQAATSLLQDAVEQAPNMSILRYHLGMSYMKEDRREAAIREFEKIVELSAEQPFELIDEVKQLIDQLQLAS